MKIAILGTGSVGRTFAVKLTSLGHQVIIGTRNTGKLLANTAPDHFGNPSFGEWHKTNSAIKLGSFEEAARFGEIIINVTMGAAAVDALNLAKAENLKKKIIIDNSNPLDFSKGMPPSLIPELSNTHSLGEEIQKKFPESNVVKTLNTMWCGLMVDPAMIGGGNHINYICGNNAEAKETVKKLLYEFGWKKEKVMDLGDISNSRATEAVLPIWLRVWGTLQNGAFNFNIVS